MKIAIRLTVDLDPEGWEALNGVERDGVRADVRFYVLNTVQGLSMFEDVGATVSEA